MAIFIPDKMSIAENLIHQCKRELEGYTYHYKDVVVEIKSSIIYIKAHTEDDGVLTLCSLGSDMLEWHWIADYIVKDVNDWLASKKNWLAVPLETKGLIREFCIFLGNNDFHIVGESNLKRVFHYSRHRENAGPEECYFNFYCFAPKGGNFIQVIKWGNCRDKEEQEYRISYLQYLVGTKFICLEFTGKPNDPIKFTLVDRK